MVLIHLSHHQCPTDSAVHLNIVYTTIAISSNFVSQCDTLLFTLLRYNTKYIFILYDRPLAVRTQWSTTKTLLLWPSEIQTAVRMHPLQALPWALTMQLTISTGHIPQKYEKWSSWFLSMFLRVKRVRKDFLLICSLMTTLFIQQLETQLWFCTNCKLMRKHVGKKLCKPKNSKPEIHISVICYEIESDHIHSVEFCDEIKFHIS